jgi:hypothetical protein
MSSKPTRYGLGSTLTINHFNIAGSWHVHCEELDLEVVSNMKLKNIKNIGGTVLGLVMLLGTGLVSSTTTQAQYPYPTQNQNRRDRNRRDRNDQNSNRPGRRGRQNDGYNNYGGSYELRQTALNAGYNEGMKVGRNDRRSNRYDPQRSSAYQKATKDYNSRLGDRGAYQRYFRDAFENGYSDGYYGY